MKSTTNRLLDRRGLWLAPALSAAGPAHAAAGTGATVDWWPLLLGIGLGIGLGIVAAFLYHRSRGSGRPDRRAGDGRGDSPAAEPSDGRSRQSVRVADYLVERFGERVADVDGARRFFAELQDRVAALQARVRELEPLAAAERQPRSGTPAWGPAAMTRAVASIRRAQQALSSDRELPILWQQVDMEGALDRLQPLSAEGGAAFVERLAAEADSPWLDGLLRAELLCAAYYPSRGDWYQLHGGLQLAVAVVRIGLAEAGTEIDPVRLLTLAVDRDVDYVEDEQLRLARLDTPRRVIEAIGARHSGRQPLVIDCLRFGRRSALGGRQYPSRLVVYNRSQWGAR